MVSEELLEACAETKTKVTFIHSSLCFHLSLDKAKDWFINAGLSFALVCGNLDVATKSDRSHWRQHLYSIEHPLHSRVPPSKKK